MGIWEHKFFLLRIAATTLFLFVAVLCLHTFIAHEHEHEFFGSGIILPIHAATGEKFFITLLLATAFVICALPPRAGVGISRVRSEVVLPRRLPPRLFLLLFMRGILHSKAY